MTVMALDQQRKEISKWNTALIGHYREKLKQSLYWPGQTRRVSGG